MSSRPHPWCRVGVLLLVQLVVLVSVHGDAYAQLPDATGLHFRVLNEGVGGANRLRLVVSLPAVNSTRDRTETFWLVPGERSPALPILQNEVGNAVSVVVTQFGRHATQTTTVLDLRVTAEAAEVAVVLPEMPDAGVRDSGAKAAATILGMAGSAELVGPRAVIGHATTITTLADPDVAIDMRVAMESATSPVLEVVTSDRSVRLGISKPCAQDGGPGSTAFYCFRMAGLEAGEDVTLRLVSGGAATDLGRYELAVGMNTLAISVPDQVRR